MHLGVLRPISLQRAAIFWKTGSDLLQCISMASPNSPDVISATKLETADMLDDGSDGAREPTSNPTIS
jgi:hypothetical protein